MSVIIHEPRLERLLELGICKSTDTQDHIKKLRQLAEKIDGDTVKRQSYTLKALADPTRIKILQLLRHKEMCTCEIMIALDLTEPNASHHLNLLERNNVIESKRIGKWVFYNLKKSSIKNLLYNLDTTLT